MYRYIFTLVGFKSLTIAERGWSDGEQEYFGLIAQSVEQHAVNVMVGGSIPSETAFFGN